MLTCNVCSVRITLLIATMVLFGLLAFEKYLYIILYLVACDGLYDANCVERVFEFRHTTIKRHTDSDLSSGLLLSTIFLNLFKRTRIIQTETYLIISCLVLLLAATFWYIFTNFLEKNRHQYRNYKYTILPISDSDWLKGQEHFVRALLFKIITFHWHKTALTISVGKRLLEAWKQKAACFYFWFL